MKVKELVEALNGMPQDSDIIMMCERYFPLDDEYGETEIIFKSVILVNDVLHSKKRVEIKTRTLE